MCRPISKGGQRCAAHTGVKYDAAQHRLAEAWRAGDPVETAAAHAAWHVAAVEYASTPKGRAEIETVYADGSAAEWNARLEQEEVTTILREGDALAAANREAAERIKAERRGRFSARRAAPTTTETAEPACRCITYRCQGTCEHVTAGESQPGEGAVSEPDRYAAARAAQRAEDLARVTRWYGGDAADADRDLAWLEGLHAAQRNQWSALSWRERWRLKRVTARMANGDGPPEVIRTVMDHSVHMQVLVRREWNGFGGTRRSLVIDGRER